MYLRTPKAGESISACLKGETKQDVQWRWWLLGNVEVGLYTTH
jgi:hypothetical protein